ncbi:MAG: V-type ATPase subunit [Deltaproteobacteria bacterium]|nr:V-type ATPase subunit [Deltaproteobacteria bacterium]
MELLLKVEDRGYPTDYLLARLRARRRGYGECVAAEPYFAAWKSLLREYRWVYLQMNSTLREIFRPFFILMEIRTVSQYLRYKTKGHTKGAEVLGLSLLSKAMRASLTQSGAMADLLAGIETGFSPLCGGFTGLAGTFAREGLRGVEERLLNTFLEHVVLTKQHPDIKHFFILLIDSRNIVALYKHLRWDMDRFPPFVRGGLTSEKKLRGVFAARDVSGIAPLVKHLTGREIASPAAGNIESASLRWISRALLRCAREPLSIAFILNYLWLCLMESRKTPTGAAMSEGGQAE